MFWIILSEVLSINIYVAVSKYFVLVNFFPRSYEKIYTLASSICDVIWLSPQYINTLSPRQNGRHFVEDIFKCIFLNENVWISLMISLKFVPKVQINNILALVQIMAWRRWGDKPLSDQSWLINGCIYASLSPQYINYKLRCHGLYQKLHFSWDQFIFC